MVCGHSLAGRALSEATVWSQPATTDRGQKRDKQMGTDPIFVITHFILSLLGF